MAHSPELTRNQKLVLDALGQAEGPASAYALLDKVREEGLKAPLQVYRALDKLMEYGLVHRLESLNAFVACDHTHGAEHGPVAFAICERCGRVDEFCDHLVTERLAKWSNDKAFSPVKTTIEMRGVCAACAA